MNASRVMQYLFRAMEHGLHACERTRRMVAIAVARFRALLAIQRAATC
jgi:hypothetical protein